MQLSPTVTNELIVVTLWSSLFGITLPVWDFYWLLNFNFHGQDYSYLAMRINQINLQSLMQEKHIDLETTVESALEEKFS